MEGGSSSRKQLPIWMNENTSYESKYADSDSDEDPDFEDDIIIHENAGDPPPVTTSPPHSSSEEEGVTLQESAHSIPLAIMSWIRESMTGDNVGDLLQIIAPHTDEESVYKELLELHQVIQQLNSELLNMFDNYLCFSGKNDEAQMNKLSNLACSRALKNLKTKQHTHSSVTEKLLLQTYEKLDSFYLEENQQISKREQEISSQVTRQILNAYEEKMNFYLGQGLTQTEAVRRKLIQECVGMLNQSLDFSAKMNNVHSEAAVLLEASMDKIFSELKSKQEETENTSAATVLKVRPPSVSPKKKPAPKPPKAVSPIPLEDRVQSSLMEYWKIVEAKWARTLIHQALRVLHDDTLSKVTIKLALEEKEAVSMATRYYFAYTSERFEESRGNSAPAAKRLCIHFTNEGIRFGLFVNQTGRVAGVNWNFDQETSSASTTLKPKDHQAFLNFLSDFLLVPAKPSQQKKERGQLIKILKRIKQEGEQLAGELDNTLIVAPTWFDWDHLTSLRGLAHDTNFKQASFLRESSLASYSLLEMPNNANRLAVIITIGDTGLFVEIFSRDADKVLKLLTVAVYKWELVGLAERGSSSNSLFSCFKGPSKSPRKSMATQENPVGILCSTYDKAVSQLEDAKKPEKKLSLLITTTQSGLWQEAYKTFLGKRTDQVTNVEPTALQSNFALKSAIALSKEPLRIRSLIVDHPIPTDSVDFIKSKPLPVPTITVQKATVKKVDHIAQRPPAALVEGDNGGEKREELLEKCKQMREQQSTGQIRLGVLLYKLVVDVIEQAENVGKDCTASLEIIMEQHAKLNEMIKQHNFDILM